MKEKKEAQNKIQDDSIKAFTTKLLKHGQNLVSFCYFRPFSIEMTNIGSTKFDYKWKKHRWCAWD